MLKPIFAVVATMCLSRGLAATVAAIRPLTGGAMPRILSLHCSRCGKANPVEPDITFWACRQCWSVSITRASPDQAESPSVEIAVDDLDTPAAE